MKKRLTALPGWSQFPGTQSAGLSKQEKSLRDSRKLSQAVLEYQEFSAGGTFCLGLALHFNAREMMGK